MEIPVIRGANLQFRGERPVNPATGGHLQQTLALCRIEISVQADDAADLIFSPSLFFAVLRRFPVDPVVPGCDLDVFQRPPFMLRIHAKCDRYSGSKCGKQVGIRPRPFVRATVRFRSIGKELVLP